MMKVIVSACLAGDNCKYNGGNNLNQTKIMAIPFNYGERKNCKMRSLIYTFLDISEFCVKF